MGPRRGGRRHGLRHGRTCPCRRYGDAEPAAARSAAGPVHGWQTLIVDDAWIVGGPLLATASAGIGIVAAIAIDAAALAYEPADDDDDDDDGALRRGPRRNALLPTTIVPMFALRTEGGAVFGVSGTLY